MKYSVDLTPTAEAQLIEAFDYIYARSPLNAQRWLANIYKAIDSLETFPHRCAEAREAVHLGEPLKQYLFKSHRIIFLVDENQRVVRILHLRHVAQRAIGEPLADDDEEN